MVNLIKVKSQKSKCKITTQNSKVINVILNSFQDLILDSDAETHSTSSG